MASPRMSKKLLSLQEAEQMTGRKVATFRKDIRLRTIQYVRLGRQVRIPVEALEDLIENGWVEPVTNIQK